MRGRFARGEPRTVAAVATLARLAHEARAALLAGDRTAFAAALDAGYDLRASIYELDPRRAAMVVLPRRLGLSSSYTGSGGAIVGVATDQDALRALKRELAAEGARLEPALVGRGESTTTSAGS